MLKNYSSQPDEVDVSCNDPEDLTLEQRIHRLKQASTKYLRGEITEDQLEELERRFATDYEEAALSMASPGKTLWSGLLNLIRGKKS